MIFLNFTVPRGKLALRRQSLITAAAENVGLKCNFALHVCIAPTGIIASCPLVFHQTVDITAWSSHVLISVSINGRL